MREYQYFSILPDFCDHVHVNGHSCSCQNYTKSHKKKDQADRRTPPGVRLVTGIRTFFISLAWPEESRPELQKVNSPKAGVEPRPTQRILGITSCSEIRYRVYLQAHIGVILCTGKSSFWQSIACKLVVSHSRPSLSQSMLGGCRTAQQYTSAFHPCTGRGLNGIWKKSCFEIPVYILP